MRKFREAYGFWEGPNMKRVAGSILIVESNLNEQRLIQEAFEELQVRDSIYTVNDGEEAIAYVRGYGPYFDRRKYKFPTFLITALNMPKIDGFELLLHLKRSKLIIIPIVVFPTSFSSEDVQKSYQFGANAFHTKPRQFTELLEVLKKIYEYWADIEIPEVDECGNLRHGAEEAGQRIRSCFK